MDFSDYSVGLLVCGWVCWSVRWVGLYFSVWALSPSALDSSLSALRCHKKKPRSVIAPRLRSLRQVGLAGYLWLKSSIHQPSSHSKETLRQPSGTWGYG